MTHRILVSLLVLLVVSCCGVGESDLRDDITTSNVGVPPTDYPGGVDPKLKPYFNLFERLRARYSKPIAASLPEPYVPAQFVDVVNEENAQDIGVCISGPGWQYVNVSRGYWETASRWERESLMLHELGHCILGREHVELLDSRTGIPLSIMYPENVGSWQEYPIVRQLLYYELFNPIE